MNARNAASATDIACPDLAWMLARLENEALHLCGLADALAVVADAMPGLPADCAPWERRAHQGLGTNLDALTERTNLTYEIVAQAGMVAARTFKAAA